MFLNQSYINTSDLLRSNHRGALGAQCLASSSLPVIDIAPLFGSNNALKRRVADEIGEAARNVGFFYIKNHTIEPTMIDEAYAQAERFFELSLSEKLAYYIGNSRNHRGYVPQSERGIYADEQGERHYEAFDLALELPEDDPDVLQGNPLLGPNVWPHLLGFKQRISAYYNAVSNLGQVLSQAFELHLGLQPGELQQYMTKPTSQLRLLHYLANNAPMTTTDMNMGAHTDYECFTILHQQKAGLQVMNANDEWMEAPPIDGSYVINIGDMLETWTNGAFKSTLHRVVNNGQERYSMPFFVAANYDAKIKPLTTVISDANPPKYNNIVAGHHLLSQLVRDFSYLRKRLETGRLKVPFAISNGNPFEQRSPEPLAIH